MLAEAGINENRLKIVSISAGEGEKYAKTVSEFKILLEKIGPIKPGEYIKPVIKEEKITQKAKLDEL